MLSISYLFARIKSSECVVSLISGGCANMSAGG